MLYDRYKYYRRSIRLKGYNYAGLGAYYITLCAWNRENLFGEIISGKMILNELGRVVYEEWANTTKIRSNILLDVFVVMPNHMHGIIIITENRGKLVINDRQGELSGDNHKEDTGCKGVLQYAPTQIVPTKITSGSNGSSSQMKVTPLQSTSQTVGAVVRGFKGAAAKRINQLRGTPGSPVWQRNYYEHIIRNQDAFDRICQYIINNPANWIKDIEHPPNPRITNELPDDISGTSRNPQAFAE